MTTRLIRRVLAACAVFGFAAAVFVPAVYHDMHPVNVAVYHDMGVSPDVYHDM